mgnify:FL=1
MNKEGFSRVEQGLIDEWDITIYYALLCHSPGYLLAEKKGTTKNAVEQLKKIRNDLSHCSKSSRISSTEFEERWSGILKIMGELLEELPAQTKKRFEGDIKRVREEKGLEVYVEKFLASLREFGDEVKATATMKQSPPYLP